MDISDEKLLTSMPSPQQSYVFNPYGGFHSDFAKNYINDYMLLPKGKSSCLIELVPSCEFNCFTATEKHREFFGKIFQTERLEKQNKREPERWDH